MLARYWELDPCVNCRANQWRLGVIVRVPETTTRMADFNCQPCGQTVFVQITPAILRAMRGES